jgi:outer membrane protein OmpA-like peptidoglycan-associated protein
MRAVSLALVSLAPMTAVADEGALTLGVSGGLLVTDPLELLDQGAVVVPRVGYEVRENAIIELDLGMAFGKTRDGDVGYLGLTPRLNFRGLLIDELKVRDENGADTGLRKVSPVQPFLVAGVGGFFKSVSDPAATGVDFPNPDLDFMPNAGPGVQFPIGDKLMLRTDYRILVNLGSERFDNHGDTLVNWEWTAGLDFVLGGSKDTDLDLIKDKLDQCPTEAEDVDAFQDADGCPDADNDGDDIPDTTDGCPNEGEDLDRFEDENGCPDPDNDGDGILDGDDSCPTEAGVASALGCPDGDGDGIRDANDACPAEAGTAALNGCADTDGDTLINPNDECPTVAGPVESFGCPDGDVDLVPDFRDECPEQKANEGIDPKRSNGCPSRVFVAAGGIRILEKVFFDSGKATIQARSHSLLDDVAATLQRYPGITKIEVQGHTDDQGADAANLTLSQGRSEAVVAYLVSKGVAAERLVARGYGETAPLEPNTSSAARANNRRVEFKILEETPTMVPAPTP